MTLFRTCSDVADRNTERYLLGMEHGRLETGQKKWRFLVVWGVLGICAFPLFLLFLSRIQVNCVVVEAIVITYFLYNLCHSINSWKWLIKQQCAQQLFTYILKLWQWLQEQAVYFWNLHRGYLRTTIFANPGSCSEVILMLSKCNPHISLAISHHINILTLSCCIY